MKSFKESLINKSNIDLSEFSIIIRKEEIPVIIEKEIPINNVSTPVINVIAEKGETGIGIEGKKGKAATVKIGNVSKGQEPLVENIGTDEDAIFNFILPEGKRGKTGENGKAATIKIGKVELGNELNISQRGSESNVILDFIIPTPINGISPTIKINSVKKGEIASVTNSGSKEDVLLDFILPKGDKGEKGNTGEKGKAATIKIGRVTLGDKAAITNLGNDNDVILDIMLPTPKDGKDGYTPIKGKDYFDGKNGENGYTPIKGIDYFDGKDGENGKDGYTPIKNKDYFDGKSGKDGKNGKDGYTPIKGIDYFDGKDGENGLPPKHELDSKGNIRFQNPDDSWGEWINLNLLIEKSVRSIKSKSSIQYSGGGTTLDYIVGNTFYKDIRYLNIDTQSLIVSQTGDVLTIGVNPNYIGNGNSGPSNMTFTFDYWKLSQDNIYQFTLSQVAITNSETVIMNGLMLTKDLDYTINNNIVTIDSSHNTKTGWNVTIKYAY